MLSWCKLLHMMCLVLLPGLLFLQLSGFSSFFRFWSLFRQLLSTKLTVPWTVLQVSSRLQN
jgi:hypothetical protein